MSPNDKIPRKGKLRTLMHALEKRMLLDATLSGLAASVTFNENTINTTPTVLDNAVTIAGSTTNFDGVALTISTTGGADDQLSVANIGTGAGQIGFRNSIVTYGGTRIGTVTSANGIDGSDLQIILNSSATQAGIEALIENITYRNQDDTPLASRTINFALAGYFSQGMTVNITAQNDSPFIATNVGSAANRAYIQQGATVTVDNIELRTIDAETSASGITYTLTAQSRGNLRLNGVNLAINGTFTQADIDAGLISFRHDNTANNASFTFSVSDGTASLTGQVYNLTRDTSNNAPVMVPNTVITTLDPSVTYNATTGNFYKYVSTSSSYDTAYKNSSNSYLNGVAGHLVTITSSAENTAVQGLIGATVWIAASDVAVEGEWRWTAGPEKGQIFYIGMNGSGGSTVNGS